MALRALRLEKGLSQARLAAKAGIAQSAIHYIENGEKSPTLYTLHRLALALEIEVGQLAQAIVKDETLYTPAY